MGKIEFDGVAEFRNVGSTSEGLWVETSYGALGPVPGPSYSIGSSWNPSDDYLIEKSSDGEELVVYDRTEGTQAKYKLMNGMNWSVVVSVDWIGPRRR